MKALSVKQPWAWLLCAGYKDIENRTWKIGRKSQHGPYSTYHRANFTVGLPCRIYVHASLSKSDMGLDICQWIKDRLTESQRLHFAQQLLEPGLYFGGIIGEVSIIDCVTESKSPWFRLKYGFVLTDPVLYGTPIPFKGRLGFFDVSDNSKEAIVSSMKEANE